MFKIVLKEILGKNVKSFLIEAPDAAKNAKAGQFVMLRTNDKGERIPLTVAGTDSQKGLVRIIFQETGKTTFELGSLEEGDYIKDFVGPLGHPTKAQKYGTVAAVAGGVGTAEVLPVIKALKEAGNKVLAVIGARNRELIILEKELESACDGLFFATDDGSYGVKGLVTDVLKNIMDEESVDMVYAIGPVPMMRAVAGLTKEKNIKTLVSLNPIMVDGTGMCGACRVTVDGKTRFACVEGPEFDAHKVNWEELVSRLSLFRDYEKVSLDKFKHNPECKCRKE